jgi:unsaturated rhamnogalacturonyl hydrolase
MGNRASLSPEIVLARTADRTYRFDFGVWFWGDAIAFDGLLDAANLLGDGRHAAFCERFVTRWSARPVAWTDYLAPALSIFRLVEAGRDDLKPTLRRLLDFYLVQTPRGDTGLHYFRPDLPQYRTTVLIDSLYHVPSFIAACGNLFADTKLHAEAIEMWSGHADALRTPGRALLWHNYDRGTGRHRGYGWGRGNGWALLGLVDLIELLPPGSHGGQQLIREFDNLCRSVVALQDASGFWRTLLEDSEANLETSTAAFFGAVFSKGRRLGLLGENYAEPCERAWRALLSRIDDEGGAFGTSAVTWAANLASEDLALYRSAPTEVNVWGQGAALRFAAERLRLVQAN